MKKIIGMVMCLGIVMVLGAGCASTVPQGSCYSDVKLPLTVTSNTAVENLKVGTATCTSWFGVYVTGDVSIDAAMKNGKITKVHHVDWRVKNIIGWAKYTVIVYGE